MQLCSLFLDGVRRLEFDRPTLPELGECRHALLGEPEVLPFEVERICAQEFRIDQMQPRLFVLQSPTLCVWARLLDGGVRLQHPGRRLAGGRRVEDLTVQLKQGNTVRETKDVKVKGESWRTRTWTGVRIAKPGEWTISVMRGEQLLKEVKLTAK